MALEFYWEVCLRKVRAIVLSHLASLMRAETPSWLASNIFNVLILLCLFVVLFLSFPLT